MDPEGGQGVQTPLKNHKNIRFICNTGQDALKIQKATKSVFNVWPFSTCERNTIYMVFLWQVILGPRMARFLWYLDSSSPHHRKKNLSKLDPLWRNFLDPRMRNNSVVYQYVSFYKNLLSSRTEYNVGPLSVNERIAIWYHLNGSHKFLYDYQDIHVSYNQLERISSWIWNSKFEIHCKIAQHDTTDQEEMEALHMLRNDFLSVCKCLKCL